MGDCACMCHLANHYGMCQVVAEPGLRPAPDQPTLFPNGPVCRPCHAACLAWAQLPWAARSHAARLRRWLAEQLVTSS